MAKRTSDQPQLEKLVGNTKYSYYLFHSFIFNNPLSHTLDRMLRSALARAVHGIILNKILFMNLFSLLNYEVFKLCSLDS